MGGNTFVTPEPAKLSNPRRRVGLSGSFPAEGMPCVRVGSPYSEMRAAALELHWRGQRFHGDGSVRFVEHFDDLTRRGMGSRGGGRDHRLELKRGVRRRFFACG